MTEGAKRATLGSRLSAVLVSAGSAVGLGNIWRFPYVAGDNGGGAFLLIYIICILVMGIPVMLAEFVVGKHTRRNSVGAFRFISRKWTFLGYNCIAAAFLILGFYFVVSGWTLEYFLLSCRGAVTQYGSAAEYKAVFDSFVGNPWRPAACTLAFVLATHGIIALGVKRGIERSSRIMMPLLLVILLVLAIRSITLPGGIEGLKFFFTPDFSRITPRTVLTAMGQAFFSLSIGLGVLVTYASYFKHDTDLRKTALSVSALDTAVAVLAGMVIFPAVFSAGIEPDSGPSLVFVTLPGIFGSMPLGAVWSAVFFLLLMVAALTSTMSLHEVITVYLHEEWRLKRTTAAWCVTVATALLAVTSSLSIGIWSDFKIFDRTLFDALDDLTANIMLPAGGLCISILAGWFLDRNILKKELTNDGTLRFRLYGTVVVLLKYAVPILLLAIFLDNTGLLASMWR